jgi:hypothetical protein
MRRAVLFGGIVIGGLLGGLLLLGAALFLGVLLGKGSGTDSGTKTPGSASEAEEKPGLVGDTKNVGELSVTLVEAFRTDGDKKEEVSRDQVPPNGTFVVARVRVQNGSSETLTWFEPYTFQAYSTDGRKLNDVVGLNRQIMDPSAPREDLLLYNTEIRPGGDVTGTIVCIAELDESVSLEFSKIKETEDEPAKLAVWEFGPVGELPKRAFESQF